MRNLYFKDVFYPTDKEALLELTETKLSEVITPKILLLPHGHLSNVSELYKKAFNFSEQINNVVILSTLHNEKSEFDYDNFLFTCDSDDAMTPIGSLDLESFPCAKVNESYFEEEYGIEIILPYIARILKNATVFPVFCAITKKEEIIKLSKYLKDMYEKDNSTLFIISGNFSKQGDKEKIYNEANTFVSLLEKGESLVLPFQKNEISCCASYIIEAFNKAFMGEWEVLSTRCGNYSGIEISKNGDGKIWHGVAHKDIII